MISVRKGSQRVQLYDELPAAGYEIEFQKHWSFPAARQPHDVVLRMVVEFYMLQGGMAQYALIGGRFEGAATESLTVAVGINSLGVHGKTFHSDLRSSVFCGLPADLADASIEGVSDYQEDRALPSGVLTIDRAAHNELD